MITVLEGDCREVLANLHAETFDACVTDPPYHLTSIVRRYGTTSIDGDGTNEARARERSDAMGRLAGGFMGKQWDGGDIAQDPALWRKVYCSLKPGAFLVAFGGTRTYHRMFCAIEDAGFEIRDCLSWLYGTGFPKSHNQKGEWEGWGTALKPAWEPICLARKPIIGNVEDNLAEFGVGAVNIDGCRIHADDAQGGEYRVKRLAPGASVNATGEWKQDAEYIGQQKPGRWPANVVHDGSDEVLQAFAEYGNDKGAIAPVHTRNADKFHNTYGAFSGDVDEAGSTFRGDAGTAARFFYSAKATKADRAGSKHPTVKPVKLMRWLCRMVTPPQGHILDPFAGSGTTGQAAREEGFHATLIERDAEYAVDIRKRLTNEIAEASVG